MPKMAQTADNWETGCAMAQMRIKDIAAEAGVSPATVSRYLNNRPGQMTQETRARIAAVIAPAIARVPPHAIYAARAPISSA